MSTQGKQVLLDYSDHEGLVEDAATLKRVIDENCTVFNLFWTKTGCMKIAVLKGDSLEKAFEEIANRECDLSNKNRSLENKNTELLSYAIAAKDELIRIKSKWWYKLFA